MIKDILNAFFLSWLVPFTIVLIPLTSFCTTQPAPSSTHHPGEVQASLVWMRRVRGSSCSEWAGRSCSWLFCSKAIAPTPVLDKSIGFSAAVSLTAWIQSGWDSPVQPNLSAEAGELHIPLQLVGFEVVLDLRNLTSACFWVLWTKKPGRSETYWLWKLRAHPFHLCVQTVWMGGRWVGTAQLGHLEMKMPLWQSPSQLSCSWYHTWYMWCWEDSRWAHTTGQLSECDTEQLVRAAGIKQGKLKVFNWIHALAWVLNFPKGNKGSYAHSEAILSQTPFLFAHHCSTIRSLQTLIPPLFFWVAQRLLCLLQLLLPLL